MVGNVTERGFRASAWFAVILCIALGVNVGALAQHAGTSGVKESQQKSHLVDLHENNWQLMLNGEWMVEFFAPWCPACKSLAPTWERFAPMAGNINVNVAKIDVTTSPSLSGRFFVTALPTIYHVKNGEFRQYRGSRDGDAFMSFLKLKQWQKIEPISAWKKPDSIHMSILSYFFKLSHTLKDFNTRLQEEYGLPTWGSYGLFAIGTIFVGAALGLMLVCIVDFLNPPKKSQRQSFSEAKVRTLNSVEDIANDDIEDDVPENGESEGEESENNDDNEDKDDEKSGSSSEEKCSGSDSEQPEGENEENGNDKITGTDINNPEGKAASNSPAEVRKRKPRKAD